MSMELDSNDVFKLFSLAQKFPIVRLGKFGTKEAYLPIADEYESEIIPADHIYDSYKDENRRHNLGVLAGKKYGTLVVEVTPEAVDNRDMGSTVSFSHPHQDKVFFIYAYNKDLKISGSLEIEDGVTIRHNWVIPIYSNRHKFLFNSPDKSKTAGFLSVEIGEIPTWLHDTIINGRMEKLHSVYERKPNHRQLAQEYLNRYPNTIYGLNKFWRFDDKTYIELQNWKVRREIINILTDFEPVGVKTTNAIITSVFEIVKTLVEIEDEKFDADEDLIALDNGIFNLATFKLMPFSPTYLITIRMAYPYDENAVCPAALKCITTSQPHGALLLQEYGGYSLTQSTKYEIALWLAGYRGSGKSTIIKIFETLLGQACGTLGLADIEKSRFGLAGIPGKKLLVSSEQPSIYISTLDIINSLISGDKLRVEQKNINGFDIIPHAKLLWAMNDLPHIKSSTDGLFRKVKILKFYKLDPSLVDLDLKDKIAKEGSGIFNWAVEGLKRLRQQDGFTYSDEILADTEQYYEYSDIVGAFINEMCVTGPKMWVLAKDFYPAYEEWCERNGHKTMNSTDIRKNLDARDIKNKKHSGQMCFMKIRLKTEGEINAERQAFEDELKQSGLEEPPKNHNDEQQIPF